MLAKKAEKEAATPTTCVKDLESQVLALKKDTWMEDEAIQTVEKRAEIVEAELK